jgi:rhodanese-related sulfurtransferase
VQEAGERLSVGGPAGPLLVDVRNPEEFVAARVPGSVFIPLPEFGSRFKELPKDRPLIVLCASGNRSAFATAHLLASGYSDVANLEGGIIAWYRAGLPVRSGPVEDGEGDLAG